MLEHYLSLRLVLQWNIAELVDGVRRATLVTSYRLFSLASPLPSRTLIHAFPTTGQPSQNLLWLTTPYLSLSVWFSVVWARSLNSTLTYSSPCHVCDRLLSPLHGNAHCFRPFIRCTFYSQSSALTFHSLLGRVMKVHSHAFGRALTVYRVQCVRIYSHLDPISNAAPTLKFHFNNTCSSQLSRMPWTMKHRYVIPHWYPKYT